MVDYKGAIWFPNNNYFPDTGKKKFLILHGTAGGTSAQSIAQYFQSTEDSNNPVSSHYIVGKDGTVVQCVAEKDGAYAQGVVNNPNWSGNPNDYTVSIEHVKSSTDNSDALTPEQQAASFALIKDICHRNGIGMHDADSSTGITGHFAIDPINRARCPGNYPWQALWDYLAAQQTEETTMIDLTNPDVARYFTAGTNGVWQCKNGYVIGGAILTFYKSFGGSALNGLTHLGLPLSNEVGLGGGRTIQRYERGVLAYDPEHIIDSPPGLAPDVQVYLAHIDSGVGQDPRVEDLQNQVVALQPASQQAVITTLETKIDQAIKALQ